MVDKLDKSVNIGQIKPLVGDDKNIFIKQAIGNFWDTLTTNVEQNKNLFSYENIQNEINSIKAQTVQVEEFLSGGQNTKFNLLI